LLDGQEVVIFIKGAMNLQQELKDQLDLNQEARYFMYVEEEMYSKRESELLQQYISEHGSMPRVNQELEDLF
jgi:hypothetical protein